MHFFACWFTADPDDAPAIHLIAKTREHRLEEWPHLILTGVDGDDVNKLERLVRPNKKGVRSPTGGKVLVRGKMTNEPFTCVCQVEAEFVRRLAALDETALNELVRKWVELIEGVNEHQAMQLLRDMAAFAWQAEEAGKPVLQLDVL